MKEPNQIVDTEAAEFEKSYAAYDADALRNKAEDELNSFLATKQKAAAPQDSVLEAEAPQAAGDGLVEEGDTDLGQLAADVGKDVVRGLAQAPRSAARGVVKGAKELVSLVDTVDRDIKSLFNLPFEKIIGKEIFPALELAQRVPVPAKPADETVTGQLIEGVAQFALGFKGVDKLLKSSKGLKGIQTAIKSKKGGKIADATIRGALADLAVFDEQEQRLSTLIQDVPGLQNPITEFLQSKEDDTIAFGKFKQALEGVGIGAAAEAIAPVIRTIRKGKSVKQGVEQLAGKEDLFNVPEIEAAGVTIEPEAFSKLGDPTSESFIIEKPSKALAPVSDEKLGVAVAETKDIVPRDISAPPTPREFQLNFARINGPDDIKLAMDSIVNHPSLVPSIQAERRGVRSNQITLTAAQDIDGFQSLIDRRTGDAFNADQIVAARKMYYDTTERLMETAKDAAKTEATQVDHFNFRKMVALHHAVQKEFMGVRAEAGRALQAWAIPLGGTGGQRVRQIEQLMNEFGGSKTAVDLARRIVSMGDNLTTDQINTITRKGAFARSVDAVTQLWTMGLLTNPPTHVVNISSSIVTAVALGGERLMASAFKDSPVTMSEVGSYFSGLILAQKEAFKNGAVAFRTGQTGIGVGSIELPRVRASSQEVLDAQGILKPLGLAMDWYGRALNIFSTAPMAMGDEYGKTITYKAQLRALATRAGISKGLDGIELKKYIAEMAEDPDDAMRSDALDFANYATFTKELGKTGQDIQSIIARNPLLRFVFPFVRTPINIFKFAFERTPLALTTKKMRDDISAGGLRKSMAMAKIGMGSSIMMMGIDSSMQGKITGAGPSDKEDKAALKRVGWQPYSIKLGNTYYSYGRFEPVATIMGMAADMSEIMTNYESYDMASQIEVDELSTAVVAAIGNQVVGKTFMRGFADLTEALSDPTRYADHFLSRFAGSFVPAGVAGIERAISPEMSYVFNKMDTIKSRIPGLSGSTAKMVNVWGEDVKAFYPSEESVGMATAQRLGSMFNPVYYSKSKDAPVDRFLLRNGFHVNMPQKIQNFDAIRIDLKEYPKIYERLVKLRGKEIKLAKYGDKNMYEAFNDIFASEDPRSTAFFSEFKESDEQQDFINRVVTDYQKAAKDMLIDEFPVIRQIVEEEQAKEVQANANRGSEGLVRSPTLRLP